VCATRGRWLALWPWARSARSPARVQARPRDGCAGFVRGRGAAAAARTGAPIKSKSGFPDGRVGCRSTDPHSLPPAPGVRGRFRVEVLRTDYLAKQLVREIEVGGRRYGGRPRAAAREPTVLIMGGARAAGPIVAGWRSRDVRGEDEHPDALASPSTPIPTTIARCRRRWRGARAAGRVAGGRRGRPTRRIRWCRLRARAGGRRARMAGGEGPAGAMPADAGRRRSATCSRRCARIASRWAPTARRARARAAR
jgi:hypothetical protein